MISHDHAPHLEYSSKNFVVRVPLSVDLLKLSSIFTIQSANSFKWLLKVYVAFGVDPNPQVDPPKGTVLGEPCFGAQRGVSVFTLVHVVCTLEINWERVQRRLILMSKY